MINIAFDTSVISKLGTSKQDYLVIKRLVDRGYVTVHIPYIVKKEMQTQRFLQNLKQLEKINREINELKKTLMYASDLSSFLEGFDNLKSKVLNDVTKNTEVFFNNWKANIYPIDIEQTINAFDAYFKGSPPLTEPKNRKDIPDSFICRAIESLANKNDIGQLVLIANDTKINGSFESCDDIKVFKSIEDFVKTEQVQTIIKTIETENRQALYDYNNDLLEFLDNFLNNEGNETFNHILSELVGTIVCGKTIRHYSIPDDNDEAIITSYDDIEESYFDFERVIHYGENKISINFTATLNVEADFFIYKADYYLADLEIIVSDWNKHYFEASDEFKIEIMGRIIVDLDSFKLDEDLQDDFLGSFNDVLFESEITVESIDGIKVIP